MTRNFGMSARPGLGGQAPNRALSLGSYAPSDSILLPPADPALKRGKFAQALIDVLAVGSMVFLASITGLGIAASIFILFFVRT